MDDILFNRDWIRKLLGDTQRPRPVCSCEVPDYAESLFDRGMYRFRCATCRGYIDLVWIYEGLFPEPNDGSAD